MDFLQLCALYEPGDKNKYEYADGGLGYVVAIEEAIRRGATHIYAIVLTTATQ